MEILFLLAGFFLGGGFAFLLAKRAIENANRRAVSCGVIKLCGKLFVLKEIDL